MNEPGPTSAWLRGEAVSDPNDVFGPVAPGRPSPDDVFGPVTSSREGSVALKAFGPCVMPGRPSGYNDTTVDAILDGIMGGKTLEQVGKTEGMPHKSTILRWAGRYSEFAKLLEQAFEWRTRLRCDEVIDIVDNRRLHPRRQCQRRQRAGDDVPK